MKSLPPNTPALFVAYYFGVEKLAKAIVGINNRQPPEVAFDRPVDLPATKKPDNYAKLEITDAAGGSGFISAAAARPAPSTAPLA